MAKPTERTRIEGNVTVHVRTNAAGAESELCSDARAATGWERLTERSAKIAIVQMDLVPEPVATGIATIRKLSATFLRSALVTALAAAVQLAPAAACDSTGCLLATRGQDGALAKGKARVDFSYRRSDLSLRLSGSRETDSVRRPWIDFRDGRVWPGVHEDLGGNEGFLQLDLAYGLTARMSAFASVPIDARRSYQTGDAICGIDLTTGGWGDALVGVRRTLVAAPGRHLAGAVAAKLATGRSGLVSEYDSAILLEPMVQPGSGSVDLVTSLQFGFRAIFPGVNWTTSVSHQLATSSKRGHRFGNETIATLGASHRLVGPFQASLQIKGQNRTRSTFLGEPLASSGATIVYVVPGIRAALPGQVTVYAYVQLPAYRYVNETQLAPRRAILMGMGKGL